VPDRNRNRLLLVGGPPTDRYGVLFIELLALVVLAPFASSGGSVRLVTFVLAVAIVVTTLRAVGAGLVVVRVALLAGFALAAALSWVSATSGSLGNSVGVALIACVVVIGPPLLVRRVFRRRRFGVQDVLAALCAYLQVALFFTYVYTAVDLFSRDPFFAQGASTAASDYLYFSFVTMLTLGYGDLTPATDLGRVLIIVETLVGQIFLVVLVAYLVGSMVGGGGPVAESHGDRPPDDVGVA